MKTYTYTRKTPLPDTQWIPYMKQYVMMYPDGRYVGHDTAAVESLQEAAVKASSESIPGTTRVPAHEDIEIAYKAGKQVILPENQPDGALFVLVDMQGRHPYGPLQETHVFRTGDYLHPRGKFPMSREVIFVNLIQIGEPPCN